MTIIYDALIIGGGPSGATIGLMLAKAGWSVAIVEKKTFPRRKVCGEYISSTTLALLPELDIQKDYFALAGPSITNISLYAGESIVTSLLPSNSENYPQWGHALGREHLDTLLLQSAQNAGATVFQPWTAYTFNRLSDYFICTIKQQQQSDTIAARIIIMAHGSWEKQQWNDNSPVHKPSDLLAFKAHFTRAALKPDTMPLLAFAGGYGGIVQTDKKRISLSCCIRRSMLTTIRIQNPGMHAGDAVLAHLINSNQGVAHCLSSAIQENSWLSVGPIQPGIRRPFANNIFFVGNCAGEAHPIIAEGISMAMQSAWMLAKILIRSRSRSTTEWTLAAGKIYQTEWQKKFTMRIYAANLFATLASNQHALTYLLPLIKAYPKILSLGARLSGKINNLAK